MAVPPQGALGREVQQDATEAKTTTSSSTFITVQENRPLIACTDAAQQGVAANWWGSTKKALLHVASATQQGPPQQETSPKAPRAGIQAGGRGLSPHSSSRSIFPFLAAPAQYPFTSCSERLPCRDVSCDAQHVPSSSGMRGAGGASFPSSTAMLTGQRSAMHEPCQGCHCHIGKSPGKREGEGEQGPRAGRVGSFPPKQPPCLIHSFAVP